MANLQFPHRVESPQCISPGNTHFSAAIPLGLTDPMLNVGGPGEAKGQIEAVNPCLLWDSYPVSSCVVRLP